MTKEHPAFKVLKDFAEEITLCGGKYKHLDGQQIVADAHRVLREADSLLEVSPVQTPLRPKMATLCNLEEVAQKIAGNDKLYFYFFQSAFGGVICKGVECPPIKSGKRKGQPCYSRRDRSTEIIVFVPTPKD